MSAIVVTTSKKKSAPVPSFAEAFVAFAESKRKATKEEREAAARAEYDAAKTPEERVAVLARYASTSRGPSATVNPGSRTLGKPEGSRFSRGRKNYYIDRAIDGTPKSGDRIAIEASRASEEDGYPFAIGAGLARAHARFGPYVGVLYVEVSRDLFVRAGAVEPAPAKKEKPKLSAEEKADRAEKKRLRKEALAEKRAEKAARNATVASEPEAETVEVS